MFFWTERFYRQIDCKNIVLASIFCDTTKKNVFGPFSTIWYICSSANTINHMTYQSIVTYEWWAPTVQCTLQNDSAFTNNILYIQIILILLTCASVWDLFYPIKWTTFFGMENIYTKWNITHSFNRSNEQRSKQNGQINHTKYWVAASNREKKENSNLWVCWNLLMASYSIFVVLNTRIPISTRSSHHSISFESLLNAIDNGITLWHFPAWNSTDQWSLLSWSVFCCFVYVSL